MNKTLHSHMVFYFENMVNIMVRGCVFHMVTEQKNSSRDISGCPCLFNMRNIRIICDLENFLQRPSKLCRSDHL